MTVDETLRTSPQTPEGQYDALTGILMGHMAANDLPKSEVARVNNMLAMLLHEHPWLAPKDKRK